MKKKILVQMLGATLALAAIIVGCKKTTTTPNNSKTTNPATPTLSATASSQSVSKAAGTVTITVSSNTSWTATSSQTWCTVSPASGSNNGTITVAYTANTTSSSRSTVITLAATGVTSVTITITQAGDDVICNGKAGNNSYFPLATGNVYVYDYDGNVSWQGLDTLKIGAIVNQWGHTYFSAKYIQGSFKTVAQYYRIDSLTNDVYKIYDVAATSTEDRLVLGTPVLNAIVSEDTYYARRVTSLNATKKTKVCSYTGCIEITTVSKSNNSTYSKEYYKKGLGLIDDETNQVKSVNLK